MSGYKEKDESIHPKECVCKKGSMVLIGEVEGKEFNFSSEEPSLEKENKMETATNLHWKCNKCGATIPFSTPAVGRHGIKASDDSSEGS